MVVNEVLREIVEDTYRGHRRAQLEDNERLAVLYGSRFWTQPETAKLTQFCKTAAYLLNTPESYVAMVEHDKVCVVASNDDDAKYSGATNTIDYSLCPHVVGVGKPLLIDNAPQHAVICDAGGVTEGGVIAYLGVPLWADGFVLGSFCVVDYKERDWTEHDALMLTHLALAIVAMHEARTAA